MKREDCHPMVLDHRVRHRVSGLVRTDGNGTASGYMYRRWLKSRVTQWDYDMTRRTLLEELKPAPGDRVLEIGSGPGTWTREVASRAKEVVAVDISEDMNAQSRRYTQGLPVQFIHSDFLEANPEGPFDKIFSVRAIEYIRDRNTLARKISHLLAPGGTVVLITKSRFSVWRGRMRLMNPWSWPIPGLSRMGRWKDWRMGRRIIRDAGGGQFLPSPGQLVRAFEPYGLVPTQVRPVVIRVPIFQHGFYEIPIIPHVLSAPVLRAFSLLYKWGSRVPGRLSFLPLLLSESYCITLEKQR